LTPSYPFTQVHSPCWMSISHSWHPRDVLRFAIPLIENRRRLDVALRQPTLLYRSLGGYLYKNDEVLGRWPQVWGPPRSNRWKRRTYARTGPAGCMEVPIGRVLSTKSGEASNTVAWGSSHGGEQVGLGTSSSQMERSGRGNQAERSQELVGSCRPVIQSGDRICSATV
jgi:hypothetical protein